MAAGLGFKTFTTGEVLTAADTNGYLMQGVLVFASSAARAAAITSPQEGQYSYLKDTNSTEYYDGAAWIAAPIGDITGVTAGTGISGGGTSGTVTITNSMATEIAAKGDLIVGTGAATFDNLTVGANGTTLVADSTASTGLKWATVSSTPTFVGCLVAGVTQSLANNTETAVTFTSTEVYDTDSFHSTSSNTSRITIPTGKGGYYLMYGNIPWQSGGPNTRQTKLYKNGSALNQVFTFYETGGYYSTQNFTTVVSAAAGDYFEIYCTQQSGGNLNIYGDSGSGNLPGLRFGCALIGV
jgi:hypothetical protein